MKKYSALLFMIVAALALVGVPARADMFSFTSDHCTGGCSTGAPNMGTITVTQNGVDTVRVQVDLQAGFGFVDTGAGAGAAFFFRLLGNPTITYSNLTSGWSIPNVIPVNQQAAGAYAGDGLMDEFEYALSCNPPGAPTGCGNGGSSPKAPPLIFDVTAAGLTVSAFNDTGNASGSPFAADVISANGRTGLIDASLSTQTVHVPEPTAVVLLGTALFGVCYIMRKRLVSDKCSV